MKDPMFSPGADAPCYRWIGYPDVAAPDRFAVPDEAAQTVYVYVPLDTACRWLALGPTDVRRLELRFHRTDEDDSRLAAVREKYLPLVKRSLDLWDHAPRGGAPAAAGDATDAAAASATVHKT